MTRLLMIIIIAITIVSGAFIIYKIAAGNKSGAHIMTSEGKKNLSPQELEEINDSVVPAMPGMQSNTNQGQGSNSDINKTIKQIEQINELNKKQQ